MGRRGGRGGRHFLGRATDVASATDPATSATSATDAATKATPSRKQRIVRGLRRQLPVIFALSGIAIAQPVLDLFGRNPEFFVAGRYSSTQVIVFALVVTLVPAGLVAAVVLAAHVLHPTVGEVLYGLAVGCFAVLFGALLLRTVGLDGFWLITTGALLVAGLVVWLDRKSEPVHRLLSWVALGNFVFVGTFLFTSPTADLILDRPTGAGGAVEMPPLRGPVVLLILDEFPVTTILDPDGTINEARYPNFARLAEGSTWFRNTSSHAAMTQYAAPTLLTGVLPDEDDLPTYGDHPQNLFSLFGDRYPIHRYETVTDMCPPSACTPPPRQSLRTALDDAMVVYGHKVLPTRLSSDLPEIGHSWGNFGGAPAGPPVEASDSLVTDDDPYGAWRNMDPHVRAARGQVQILEQMTSQVSAEPALHMAHVALPHYPWRLTPFGPSLTREFRNDLEPDDPAFDAVAHMGYQTHSLQVGAADVAIGAMIDHLQTVGAWDDALVVVTSDHGVSLTPPDLGRRLTDGNAEELLRVPLFIKEPGQTGGEVSDDVAQTIDVLPSIVDLLDAETDWEFDGHSLFDGSQATVEPAVEPDLDPALDVAARHAAAQPYGQGWDALGAVGELGSLVGSTVAEHTVGDPSELRWELNERDLLGSLPTPANEVPLLLTGAMVGSGDHRPPDVAVAVNGTFAGVAGGYVRDGGSWRFMGVMSPFFRDGANEVTAYEVERTSGDQSVLHPVGDV